MTWPRVPLGEIFAIARGGSPRPIDAFVTDDPDGVNWIMIGDATEGAKYISSTKKRIRREGVSRSRTVKPGDFLLTNSMSFGHPYILNTTGCIHDGWLVLSPQDDNVNQDYFYHLLGSPFVYAEFERLAAGAVVKNLNSELVRGVKVPFPPLPEQRRIADILDKADAIRRKRKEAIALTEELLRSAFLEMFGDPVTDPRGWPVKRLEDVADVQLGKMLSPRAKGGVNTFPYLRNVNVQWGRIDLSELVEMNFDEREQEKFSLRKDDLVVCEGGEPGRCAVVERDLTGIFFQKALMRVRPLDGSIDTRFLQRFMSLAAERGRFAKDGNQATIAHFPAVKLKALEVPLPPVRRQVEYAQLVARTEALTEHLEGRRAGEEDLFNCLVARAFSGALESSR